MASDVAFRQVIVAEMADEAAAVVSLRLEKPDGRPMAPFEPGSHVELQIPNGSRRAYSICSDPADLSHYTLGVLREEKSRGGSAYIHEVMEAGDVLLMSEPKNSFALSTTAAKHVFIAGGIGVTPFLPMMRRLKETSRDFDIHYLARDRERSCFLDQIEAIAGDRHKVYWSSTDKRFDPERLSDLVDGPDVQAYCCGPKRLMDAVLKAALPLNASVLFESFAEAPVKGIYAGAPFEIEIKSSGEVISVSDTKSMLEALRESGHDIAFSCEHGICGTCLVRYTKGQPIHRDGVLTQETRKSMVAPCISRAKERLVLDL